MRAVHLVITVVGALGVAAACTSKATVPAVAATDEPDADVVETSAAACNESCQVSDCCGTIEGLRVDLDRKCRAREWTDIGCVRRADGDQPRCMILDDDPKCIYRETDAGLEVYGHQFGVLPRGFEHCTVAIKERYVEVMQGEPCPWR